MFAIRDPIDHRVAWRNENFESKWSNLASTPFLPRCCSVASHLSSWSSAFPMSSPTNKAYHGGYHGQLGKETSSSLRTCFWGVSKVGHSQISVWKPMASLYVWYERMSFQAPDWPPPCCGGTLPGGLTMPRPAHVAVERLIWPCRRKAAMLVTACVWWRLRCCWRWWRFGVAMKGPIWLIYAEEV